MKMFRMIDPRGQAWYVPEDVYRALESIDRVFPDAVVAYARCCRSSGFRETFPLTNLVKREKDTGK